LERAQPVSQHHDLVEEGLDRPGLFLQSRRAGTERQRAPAPLLGRRHRADAGLLADDPAEHELEIRRAAVDRHGRRNPFAVADDGEGLAVGFDRRAAWCCARVAAAGLRRLLRADPRTAAVVVFAVAVAAHDADRTSVAVDHDDRVHAIGLAGAAVVLDRLTRAVSTI